MSIFAVILKKLTQVFTTPKISSDVSGLQSAQQATHQKEPARLRFEFIPKTQNFQNARSVLRKATGDWKPWRAIAQQVKHQAGGRCEICGGGGSSGLDCHEVWSYDTRTSIQKLVALEALCKDCHNTKHINRLWATPFAQREFARLLNRYAAMNHISHDKAEQEYEDAKAKKTALDQHKFNLDLSLLGQLRDQEGWVAPPWRSTQRRYQTVPSRPVWSGSPIRTWSIGLFSAILVAAVIGAFWLVFFYKEPPIAPKIYGDVPAVLSAGAPITTQPAKKVDESEMLPLHWAAMQGNEEVVRQLLGSGVAVNVADKAGNQAIHFAAEQGHEKVVQILLDAGAKVNAENFAGEQPIHRAASPNNEKMVRLLVRAGAKMDAPIKNGLLPLHLASAYGAKVVVSEMLDLGAKVDGMVYKSQAIHYAAAGGHHEVVQLLIDRGASVDALNFAGRTALHEATDARSESGAEDVVKVLLAAGATPGVKDTQGNRPIDLAAERRLRGVMTLLMQKGEVYTKPLPPLLEPKGEEPARGRGWWRSDMGASEGWFFPIMMWLCKILLITALVALLCLVLWAIVWISRWIWHLMWPKPERILTLGVEGGSYSNAGSGFSGGEIRFGGQVFGGGDVGGQNLGGASWGAGGMTFQDDGVGQGGESTGAADPAESLAGAGGVAPAPAFGGGGAGGQNPGGASWGAGGMTSQGGGVGQGGESAGVAAPVESLAGARGVAPAPVVGGETSGGNAGGAQEDVAPQEAAPRATQEAVSDAAAGAAGDKGGNDLLAGVSSQGGGQGEKPDMGKAKKSQPMFLTGRKKATAVDGKPAGGQSQEESSSKGAKAREEKIWDGGVVIKDQKVKNPNL